MLLRPFDPLELLCNGWPMLQSMLTLLKSNSPHVQETTKIITHRLPSEMTLGEEHQGPYYQGSEEE